MAWCWLMQLLLLSHTSRAALRGAVCGSSSTTAAAAATPPSVLLHTHKLLASTTTAPATATASVASAPATPTPLVGHAVGDKQRGDLAVGIWLCCAVASLGCCAAELGVSLGVCMCAMQWEGKRARSNPHQTACDTPPSLACRRTTLQETGLLLLSGEHWPELPAAAGPNAPPCGAGAA
jgi:hypothetical protein